MSWQRDISNKITNEPLPYSGRPDELGLMQGSRLIAKKAEEAAKKYRDNWLGITNAYSEASGKIPQAFPIRLREQIVEDAILLTLRDVDIKESFLRKLV